MPGSIELGVGLDVGGMIMIVISDGDERATNGIKVPTMNLGIDTIGSTMAMVAIGE